MIVLCTNSGREFISAKLHDIYNQKGIAIKYITQYMHEENELAK